MKKAAIFKEKSKGSKYIELVAKPDSQEAGRKKVEPLCFVIDFLVVVCALVVVPFGALM